ncbi:MAG: hypothetical protein QGH25_06955 [Candidatus Latescibacteria bacterium]|nr:hypothetical protein [Candidatus Latescibacterota bacterium]
MLLLGPLFIALSFALMFLQVEPFATFFYLFAWYGLVFTWDQLIRAREGRSLVARCGAGGCALILFWSAVGWLLFELINFRLENWYYVFVTDQPWLRLVATFLAFATVFPGIFWVEHYLALHGVAANARWRPLRFSPRGLYLLQALGVLSLILPLLWPVYFFPLVWGATILLAAPHNYRLGLDGYLRQLERGDYGQTLRLLLAGLIAGLFWEFFNFWARAKWIYTVPFFDELKLFEMPVAGFLGFPPFAVECAIAYRLLVWYRLAPAFGAYNQQKPQAGSIGVRAALIAAALIGSLAVDYYMERWTVTSVTPRVERVEPLDAGTLQALQDRDIRYLTQLEGWEAEAHWGALQKTLEPQQYADLRRLTALYLHQGIGVDYGNWLVRGGIGSLAALGASSAEKILEKLQASAPAAPLPSPARVRVWIRRAPAHSG